MTKSQAAKRDGPARALDWFAREAVREHPGDFGAALAAFRAIEDDPTLLVQLVGRDALDKREADYLRFFWRLAQPKPRPDAPMPPDIGTVTPFPPRRKRGPVVDPRSESERIRHDLEDAGIYRSHIVDGKIQLGMCKRVTLVTVGRQQSRTGAFYLALAGLLPDEHQTVRQAIPLAEAERLLAVHMFSGPVS